MNKCMFIGRTTKEAELRYTQGPTPIAVANVPIAVDDGYGESKTTSFFDLVLWGKRAEAFAKTVLTGTKVAVEARARQNKWTDRDGNKRYSITFHVDNWEFAQSKGAETDTRANDKGGDDFMEASETILEDLPFN